MQEKVHGWVTSPGHTIKYFPPFEMLAQLSEEVGEIAREIAHLHGHKKKKVDEKTDGLESEVGDVLFVLVCIANSHNIDLGDAFTKSLEKNMTRDKERFIDKRSDV